MLFYVYLKMLSVEQDSSPALNAKQHIHTRPQNAHYKHTLAKLQIFKSLSQPSCSFFSSQTRSQTCTFTYINLQTHTLQGTKCVCKQADGPLLLLISCPSPQPKTADPGHTLKDKYWTIKADAAHLISDQINNNMFTRTVIICLYTWHNE